MREIINLQIGQGGNQVGNAFWNSLFNEHNINNNGQYAGLGDNYSKELIDVYFDQPIEGKYQPRSLQIDSDTGTLDAIILSQNGRQFQSSSFISGGYGAGNCYGKGRYEQDFDHQVYDEVRRITEKCDSFQGFQFIRSLGGGTGSGFGDCIMSRLREEYPDRIISNFCIFPSPLVSDTVVEPYNAVLSIKGLIENSDLCFLIDNSALYKLCTMIKGIKNPIYKDLNEIAAQGISGVTSCWRFPNLLYNDMRRFSMNLNPFPNLKFQNIGLAPLYHQEYQPKRDSDISEMVGMLKNNRNFLCHTSKIDSCIEFSSISVLRGENVSEQEVEEAHLNAYQYDRRFSPSLFDNNMRFSICRSTFNHHRQTTAVKISSGTSVLESLEELYSRFSIMFRRKAFLFHGYSNMDEMEFTECQSILEDIIEEYNNIENNVYDSHSEDKEKQGKDQEDSFIQQANSFMSVKFTK